MKEFQEEFLQKIESSLKSLRIADLEIFITAAHMKNLGKSATFHHLSQSAASSAIQRVEASFGIALCTHEKRQFGLTREGELLFPRIESWVRSLRDLIISKECLPIRLATTHAIAQIAVPPLLQFGGVEFQYMRPDHAYGAILQQEADIALVLDNAPWKGVVNAEVGSGYFQLYAKRQDVPMKPVLLSEDQTEVLSLQQSWLEAHGYALPMRARIPSWSLIASICSSSDEVGFLPDFLAKKVGLFPVLWQPSPTFYRVLALSRQPPKNMQERLEMVQKELRRVFTA